MPEAGVHLRTAGRRPERVGAGRRQQRRVRAGDGARLLALLVGEPPRPPEMTEFEQLWKSFKTDHQYGVERMLHDLIMTEAYGVP